MNENRELPSCKQMQENKIEELRNEGFSLKIAFWKSVDWFESTYKMKAPHTEHTLGYKIYPRGKKKKPAV